MLYWGLKGVIQVSKVLHWGRGSKRDHSGFKSAILRDQKGSFKVKKDYTEGVKGIIQSSKGLYSWFTKVKLGV